MALLPATIIEPKIKQTATFIFLHGLGDTGAGWAHDLHKIVPPYCKVVCPNAREMPVTLNMGMVMPAWYDLYDLGIGAKQDDPGIQTSSKELAKWVTAEKNVGIRPNRIVVGGFSQGGSTALYYGVTTSEDNLGGLVALSSWLPLHEKLASNNSMLTTNRSIPILQCHGKTDPIVPYELGALTNSILHKLGFTNCTFSSYPDMGHCSCSKEIADLKTFLNKCLPEVND